MCEVRTLARAEALGLDARVKEVVDVNVFCLFTVCEGDDDCRATLREGVVTCTVDAGVVRRRAVVVDDAGFALHKDEVSKVFARVEEALSERGATDGAELGVDVLGADVVTRATAIIEAGATVALACVET